jgi:hypothetical protein
MPGLISPSFAAQNTTATNDLFHDGYGWASAKPILVDSFGKIILLAQRQNGSESRHVFVVSNDHGATWVDTPRTGFFDANGEGFIERGTVAYDPVNDLLHVLWNFSATSDGIVYRRYALTRDGSNNITGVARVAGINIQLDIQAGGSMQYAHPWIIWVPEGGANGSVLCGWSARNMASGGVKNELRVTMRKLSNTAADHTNANWIAPVTAATDAIGNAPTVAYSVVEVNSFGALVHSAGMRKQAGTNALDVYVAFNDGDVSGVSPLWRFRRLRWNAGAEDWSTGFSSAVTLSPMKVAGVDSGYAQKYQLQTQWSEDDANDRMYVGFPIWKNDTDGDTFSFVHVNAADVVSARVDVYSAGGVHSFAPVCDLVYDDATGQLVASYGKTGDEFAYVKLYDDAGVEAQAETLMFGGDTVDIPLIHDGRIDTTKLLSVFRLTVGPPFDGYTGTMTWEAAPTVFTMVGSGGVVVGGAATVVWTPAPTPTSTGGGHSKAKGWKPAGYYRPNVWKPRVFVHAPSGGQVVVGGAARASFVAAPPVVEAAVALPMPVAVPDPVPAPLVDVVVVTQPAPARPAPTRPRPLLPPLLLPPAAPAKAKAPAQRSLAEDDAELMLLLSLFD